MEGNTLNREKIYLEKNENVIRYGYDRTSVYVTRRRKAYDVRKYELIHPRRKAQLIIKRTEIDNNIIKPEIDPKIQNLQNQILKLLNSPNLQDHFLMKKINCLLFLTDEIKYRKNEYCQISIKDFDRGLPDQYHIAFNDLLKDLQILLPDKPYIIYGDDLELSPSILQILEYYYGKEQFIQEQVTVDD